MSEVMSLGDKIKGYTLNGMETTKMDYGNDSGVSALDILNSASGHMSDRASTYDAPNGERSMGKTVAMFNTLYDLNLTEEQGWMFMCLLKQVRSSQGDFRADNYEDLVAYAALTGESAKGRGK